MKIFNFDQGSEEWLEIRSGRPTASNASKMITSTGAESKQLADYAETLAGNMFAGKNLDAWMGNIHTDKGIETETNARLYYELQNGVTVEQVGFITDDMEQYGCSPDGMVGDDGLLEIKCLSKRHIKALLYFNSKGTPMPEFIPQCQMQLFITDRDWVDLMFYHDDLPVMTIRINKDIDFHNALEKLLLKTIGIRDDVLSQLRKLV